MEPLPAAATTVQAVGFLDCKGRCLADGADLEACIRDLVEAEKCWGADDAHVAQCLRRLALLLEYQGRGQQAIPLWIRVLEIEQPVLGSRHPDVVALEARIRAELARPTTRHEAAIEFASRLPGDPSRPSGMVPRVCVQPDGSDDDTGLDAGEWRADPRASRDAMAIAKSVGGAAAASIGGAVVSGAIHVGASAVSSTCSLVADAASRTLSRATGSAVAAVVPETAGWTSTVAELASSTALGTARLAASAGLGAAQQVGTALASSTTTSVLSFVGQQAVEGTAYAASGAWGLVRSALLTPNEKHVEARPTEHP
mmetsp:Transcript_120688/g.336771  ORF Transcript_120688/g.336771 Transcript_120688/m.336771 type:complete len:313 (-) Transcript_120688:47-985(-)